MYWKLQKVQRRNITLSVLPDSLAKKSINTNGVRFKMWSQSTVVLCISHSVTQSAFASTSDRLLCFPGPCVGLIGPHPSDYAHALSACYYFLQAVFLSALGLWSSPPARRFSHDTSYSFLTFSVFFCFFLKYWKDRWKLHQSSDRHIQLPTRHFWGCVDVFWEIKPTWRSPTGSKFTNVLVLAAL